MAKKELVGSWIKATEYESDGVGTGTGTLILWTEGCGMCYSAVPFWMVGLIHAGVLFEGKRSHGKAYHRLLRGKGFAYSRLPAPTVVPEIDLTDLLVESIRRAA